MKIVKPVDGVGSIFSKLENRRVNHSVKRIFRTLLFLVKLQEKIYVISSKSSIIHGRYSHSTS